jgi:3-oxoadipate enol-lactonase
LADDVLDPARIDEPAAPHVVGPGRRPLTTHHAAEEAENLAPARTRHLIEPKILPLFDENLAPSERLLGVGRERASIDGPHRRSAEDVERDRTADVFGHVSEDVHHDADLVGAPSGPPRQNERHLRVPVLHHADVTPRPRGRPSSSAAPGWTLRGTMRRMSESHSERLRFVEEGQGDPIVLLHAFPLDGAMWDAERKELARSHRVIVPDLRGFGRSELLQPRSSLDDHADDVIALLTVLGLSMGGYIALALAKRYAARLARLILADTRSLPDAPEAKKGRNDNIALVASDGVAPLLDRLLPKLLSANASAAVTDRVRALGNRQTQAGVIAALAAMRDRPDSGPVLSRIAVPTLVIVGELDVISPLAEARAIASAIPKAQLAVIEGAGHLANLESSARFLSTLRKFLDAN